MIKNQVLVETLPKKRVSPKQKKRAVKDAAKKGLCLFERACSYLSLSWSTFSYRPKQTSKKAQRLAERIVTLSWEHPRYGYRRIRALLVKEGWTTSRKFVQAVRRSEGLEVKPPKKRRPRQRSLRDLLLKQLPLSEAESVIFAQNLFQTKTSLYSSSSYA